MSACHLGLCISQTLTSFCCALCPPPACLQEVVTASGRVDLDLQKMASGPRLLATFLETDANFASRTITRAALEQMQIQTLQNDPRITGVLPLS